jgi:hypothetical protein
MTVSALRHMEYSTLKRLDSRPRTNLGRSFDLAAGLNDCAFDFGFKRLNLNLTRHDPHFDKPWPNASHGFRKPGIERRTSASANKYFRGEDWEPAARH